MFNLNTGVESRVFAEVLLGGEELPAHVTLPLFGLVRADVLLQVLILRRSSQDHKRLVLPKLSHVNRIPILPS